MLLLLLTACLLGAASFGCGMLPLSVSLSKAHLARLSTLGTGMLLGTALGVIIPEGIEALITSSSSAVPTARIALSLITGFVLMLVVEQSSSSHPSSQAHSRVEFDTELADLERDQSGIDSSAQQENHSAGGGTAAASRAYSLTLGLVLHALADGLALGASFQAGAGEAPGASNLSLIVFLAIFVHKAPTALALTSSLLSFSLPRADCKKHLAAFSASTPLATVLTYLLLEVFSIQDYTWTGTALLFSGGTFLYVATVLQPVSHSHSHAEPSPAAAQDELDKKTRTALIAVGMFVPFLLGALLDHRH